MKMKKTVIVLLAIAMLAVMFSACAGNAAPSASGSASEAPGAVESPSAAVSDSAGAPAKEKYNIGVSWQGATNDWASAVAYHFDYGFNVKYADKVESVTISACNNDDKKQIADVEDLLSKGIDLLLIQPVTETSLATVIEKAKDSGVPVVVFGAGCGTDVYDTYINRDNYKTGFKYAEWMGKRLNGKGNIIVIMGFPGSGYSNDVLRGVDDGLKNYPEIKVLGTEYAQYTPATSKQIIESYLAKGEKIDGVLVDGGLMDFGVLEAFTDAKLPIPPTTGDDWTGFLRKAKELNYTDFVSQAGGSELALDAVDAVFKVLAGEQVAKDDLREPKYYEGKDILTQIKEDMPDSFWLSCQIPDDQVGNYYKK